MSSSPNGVLTAHPHPGQVNVFILPLLILSPPHLRLLIHVLNKKEGEDWVPKFMALLCRVASFRCLHGLLCGSAKRSLVHRSGRMGRD